MPQPHNRPPIPIAALVDDQLYEGPRRRFSACRHAARSARLGGWDSRRSIPKPRQTNGKHFEQLTATEQDALLARMQGGELKDAAWGEMSAKTFFENRMAHDIVRAYYAHPTAWSEIGWGGPASPRGYVRMGFDRRDPWEAAEVKAGDVARPRAEEPPCRMIHFRRLAQRRGARRTCFSLGGWIPMREHR